MTCKGICVRYKAQKPVGTGRYASGQRRCQICEIFIKWEGLWCPCCGYRLRTKPRNLKYKAKLRARVEADSIEAKTISVSPEEIEIEEAAEIKTKPTPKRTTTKSKSSKITAKGAKTKEKTACQYCSKLFANVDKHEKRCKKNPDIEDVPPKTESIAIKA